MELKINIEKKHLIVFGVFVLLVVGGYAIADNWDSSKPFHETLFTDFITSKSEGPVKIGDGGVNLTIASWPGQPGTLSFILPDSYSGSSTYGKISFYGPTRTGEDQYDLSEFSVQADKIKLSGGDVEITGNLDVSGSCNGCGGGGGSSSSGPACAICKSCGGDWPIEMGRFASNWNDPSGYGDLCQGDYTFNLGVHTVFLCCEGELTPLNAPIGSIFITSTFHKGNLGGISGADQICEDEASGEGDEGEWIALLSNFKDRIPNDIGVIKNMHGDKIADNKGDLLDGSLVNLIKYEIDGFTTVPSENRAWSGSNSDGSIGGGSCGSAPGWTSSAGSGMWSTGGRGTIGRTDSHWIDDGSVDCDNYYRLYCLKIGA